MGSPPQKAGSSSGSHFGDFVQRFAWACLLRPAGVRMLNEEPRSSRSMSEEEEEDSRNNNKGPAAPPLTTTKSNSSFKEAKEEAEESFHEAESLPDYFKEESDKLISDSSSLSMRVQALEGFIGEVFATVSALKGAYIQLQAAHSPFDPEKLRLADKAVIVELRRLSELKHSFKEKQQQQQHSARSHHSGSSKASTSVEEQNEELRRKIQELQAASNMKQRAVETYEARARALEKGLGERQAEIDGLRESLRRSTAKKEKLERRIRKWEQQRSSARENGGGLYVEASPTPQLFEVAVQGAREAAFGFSKLLVSLMRGAQWDLEAAAESIEPGIRYAKPAHRRFAFESYICHRMFCGFENENFYINGSLSSILDPAKHRAECFLQFRDMRAVDPSDLVGITPECLFGKFCHRKYLQIVHEKMEESFFGGFEQHRDVILAGAHPRTRFYQSFLRFAKAVWLVHRLAFSFDPTASIFQVKRGTQFDPTFMESSAKNVRISDEDEGVRPRVGFTVIPGFRVEKWVIKCQVYLDGMVASED